MLKRIYFPGLDGLRFLAAMAVIVNHIEELKSYAGFPSAIKNDFLANQGSKGVTLFFTLSGFLITYLLLKEKTKTFTINIKQFYIRRILRIWPLYFVIVILSFIILPHYITFYDYNSVLNNRFKEKLMLYVLFLPNVALILYPYILYAWHLWSVGVEEQFYLIWPWLIKYTTNIKKTLIFLLLFLLAFKLGIKVAKVYFFYPTFLKYIDNFLYTFRIECMAIGGIGAYFLHAKKEIPRLIHNKIVLVFSVILMLICVYFSPRIFGVELIFSIFSILLILNLIELKSPNILENKLFSFLGRISYGLYMYHPILIVLSIKLIKTIGLNNLFFINILLYGLSISGTILVAALSFYLFERKLLSLKPKYTVIKSGIIPSKL